MKRRTQAALVALGVVLAVVAPVGGTAAGALLDALSGGKSAGENVVFNKSDGPRVVAGEEFNFTTENPWATSGQITLDPYVTVSGPPGSQTRLDVLKGTWTNMSSIDTGGGTLAVTVNDKQDVTLEGGVTDFDYRDVALDDGTADFVYAGPDGGTTTLTIADVSPGTQMAAVDATGDVLDISTSTAGGSVTFSLPQSEHTVRLQTSAGGPTIDDASLSPNTTATTVDDAESITLSANVSDPDYPGDEVTVEFFVDGSKVGEDTLQNAGTASVTVSEDEAGVHDWYAVATDAYGNSDTSATASYAMPGELLVFNEEQPTQRIDNTTLRIRFFEDGSQRVTQRDVTDGSVNMTGLPATDQFVVTIQDQGTAYQYRRIVLTALVDQQEIYLLPDNATAANINFQLEDATGEFPSSQSTLFVERPLTKDFDGDGTNETRYRTIAGDNFGASEDFPVTLALNERYRLRVENQDGQTRVLGAYTPTGDATEPIPIGRVSFEPENATASAVDAHLVTADNGDRVIRVTYRDIGRETSDLTIGIKTEDGSTTLEPNTTYSGPFGTYRATYPVPASAPEDVTYEVFAQSTRNGETRVDTIYVGDIPTLPPFGMDPTLLSLGSYIAIMAVLGFTAIKSPAYCGIPTTAVAGFLTAVGFVSIPPLYIGGAGVVSLLFAAGGEIT